MTRIVISSHSGPPLEVEKAAFDAGFFPDYAYVRDAAGAVAPYVPGYLEDDIDALLATPTSKPAVRLKAAYVAPLPTVGSLTYNSDGTVASDQDGNTYTWNTDGTPKTQTKGGVTRTFNWNADGTLASVS